LTCLRPPLLRDLPLEVDPLGGGAEGNWEVEEPVEDPGPPGRWAVSAGGAGLPLFDGCGKASATRGSEGPRERGDRMRSLGAPGAGRAEGNGGAGAGCGGRAGWWDGTPSVPTHPLVHGIRRGGVKTGPHVPFFFPLVTFFLRHFLGAHLTFLGQAWAEGKRGACSEPLCAVCGRETRA